LSVAMMITFTDCGGAHTRTLDSRLDSRVGYTECTAWVVRLYTNLQETSLFVLKINNVD